MHNTIPTHLTQRDITLGEAQGTIRRLIMPWSEVCMSMGIANRAMLAMRIGDRAVQLFDLEGAIFSAPITLGEAGWRNNA